MNDDEHLIKLHRGIPDSTAKKRSILISNPLHKQRESDALISELVLGVGYNIFPSEFFDYVVYVLIPVWHLSLTQKQIYFNSSINKQNSLKYSAFAWLRILVAIVSRSEENISADFLFHYNFVYQFLVQLHQNESEKSSHTSEVRTFKFHPNNHPFYYLFQILFQISVILSCISNGSNIHGIRRN